jgi:hypothetical protein
MRYKKYMYEQDQNVDCHFFAVKRFARRGKCLDDGEDPRVQRLRDCKLSPEIGMLWRSGKGDSPLRA